MPLPAKPVDTQPVYQDDGPGKGEGGQVKGWDGGQDQKEEEGAGQPGGILARYTAI